jgi:transcriptional regulator with XRE-family HTH domain
MISGLQSKLARAALGWSLEFAGAKVGVRRQALFFYERGKKGVGPDKVERLEKIYSAAGIYFGPSDGVSVGRSAFGKERELARGLYALLAEAGVEPSAEGAGE